jgi:hypothetical protein
MKWKIKRIDLPGGWYFEQHFDLAALYEPSGNLSFGAWHIQYAKTFAAAMNTRPATDGLRKEVEASALCLRSFADDLTGYNAMKVAEQMRQAADGFMATLAATPQAPVAPKKSLFDGIPGGENNPDYLAEKKALAEGYSAPSVPGDDWHTDFENAPKDKLVWLWRDQPMDTDVDMDMGGNMVPWTPYLGWFQEFGEDGDQYWVMLGIDGDPGDAMNQNCNRPTHWMELKTPSTPRQAHQTAQAAQPTVADYEEVLADHRRLVRELDVALNGEDGAAKQASLCDIVSQVKDERLKLVAAQPTVGRGEAKWPTREEVKQLLIGTVYEGGEYMWWDFNPDDNTSHLRATIGNYNKAGFMLLVDAMRNAAKVQQLQARLTATEAMCERLVGALKSACDDMCTASMSEDLVPAELQAMETMEGALTAYENHKKEMGK